MPEEQTLKDLARQFAVSLGEWLKQHAAELMREVLMRPLRHAALMAVVLGVSFGLALTGGVFAALSLFNLLLDWLGSRAAAYAVAFGVCVALSAVCVLIVRRSGKPRASPPKPSHPTTGTAGPTS